MMLSPHFLHVQCFCMYEPYSSVLSASARLCRKASKHIQNMFFVVVHVRATFRHQMMSSVNQTLPTLTSRARDRVSLAARPSVDEVVRQTSWCHPTPCHSWVILQGQYKQQTYQETCTCTFSIRPVLFVEGEVHKHQAICACMTKI